MSTGSVARMGVCAGVVVVAVQAALLAGGNSGVLHGRLIDPDCYMHLQRAWAMLIDHRWHEALDFRINAPDGFAIHWTSLFDLLLTMGASLLAAFGIDPHLALLIWGSAISPILLIIGLAIFAWGVQGRLSLRGFIGLSFLFFVQSEASGYFLAGRPDHHSLVLGLLFAQLAWAVALLDGRAGPRTAVCAGILAGIQLATSVEALLTILLMTSGLTAVWVIYGKRHLSALALYLAACGATALVWLLWDGGTHLLHPAYERLSIAHLMALGSGLAGFVVLWLADRRYAFNVIRTRAGAAALAGIGAALATAAAFPDFFLGPWPHLDPVILAWHKQIIELAPLLPTTPDVAANFLAQMTDPLVAVVLVIKLLWRGPEDDKPLMLFLLVGFAIFFPLALHQERFAAELQIVMLLPFTLAASAIMRSTWAVSWRGTKVPLRSVILAGILLAQILPSILLQSGFHLDTFRVKREPRCDWSGAIAALPGQTTPGGIVLAPLWYGPEILWRTGLRTVAAPYEIPPALSDTAAFFQGSEAAAHQVAKRRHISYVLICKFNEEAGFGQRLANGKAPAWLSAIAFTGAPPEFHLYAMRP